MRYLRGSLQKHVQSYEYRKMYGMIRDRLVRLEEVNGREVRGRAVSMPEKADG